MDNKPGGQEQAKYDRVFEKAMRDKAYRKRLKADPRAVLKEAGIEVPEGVEVRIRDFDPDVRYLFLPPPMDESREQ